MPHQPERAEQIEDEKQLGKYGNAQAGLYYYDWNTGTSGNGPHTLKARVTDKAGNQGISSLSVTVDNTLPSASIATGMHAFVVPRALYMESHLKVRIEGGTTWPLDSTEFFAEDTAQAEMSEAVTAVTVGSLTGSQAHWLLQYLLQNTTGDLVYEAVDVTSYVPLLNLPTDALQIIP